MYYRKCNLIHLFIYLFINQYIKLKNGKYPKRKKQVTF